jgi:hypothetical protein
MLSDRSPCPSLKKRIGEVLARSAYEDNVQGQSIDQEEWE